LAGAAGTLREAWSMRQAPSNGLWAFTGKGMNSNRRNVLFMAPLALSQFVALGMHPKFRLLVPVYRAAL